MEYMEAQMQAYYDAANDALNSDEFSAWIETLETEVVQGEYGYEPGEFNVTPINWFPLFARGLSPLEAFKSALDAHAEARKETK